MAKVKNIRTASNVTIELGGKERTIKFDLNAFAELENRFGSVQEAMEGMRSGGMKATRTMLWAGLIHAEAVIDEVTGEPISYNITPYQVGGWLAPNRLAEVSEKLSAAIMQSMPDLSDVPGAVEELEKIAENNKMATVVYTKEEQEAEALKNA